MVAAYVNVRRRGIGLCGTSEEYKDRRMIVRIFKTALRIDKFDKTLFITLIHCQTLRNS